MRKHAQGQSGYTYLLLAHSGNDFEELYTVLLLVVNRGGRTGDKPWDSESERAESKSKIYHLPAVISLLSDLFDLQHLQLCELITPYHSLL